MAMKAQIRELRHEKPEEDKTKNIGLRGVTVADTKISDVDGENGVLIYRGYRIEELAKILPSRRRRICFYTTHCPRQGSFMSSRAVSSMPGACRVLSSKV